MTQDAVGWHESIAGDFDARYDLSAAFRERLGVWTGLIQSHIEPSAQVLDAGCGSGVMAAQATALGAAVTGFDGSAAMLDLARRRLPDARLLEGRLGDPLLLRDATFDVILCSSVLEYLDDWEAGLAWLGARLRPSGVIIASLPNRRSAYRRLERLAFRLTGKPRYYAHVRHVVSLEEARKAMQAQGLSCERHVYYASTPWLGAAMNAMRRPDIGSALFAFVARKT